MNGKEPSRRELKSSEPGWHVPLSELGPPEMIEIEPIHTCNLRCVMCHVSYEKLTHEKLDVERVLRNLGGLENRWVVLGATHEPAAHPQFARLVQGLGEAGMKIKVTTNGTLFTDRLIAEIVGTPLDQVVISFDGMRKETYERIRRNANFERALDRIQELRGAFRTRPTHFHVNYTLMRSNLDEALEAVEFWDRLEFSHVGFIPMVIRDRNDLLLHESVRSCLPLAYAKLEEVARAVIERGLRITVGSALFQKPMPLKREYPDNFHGSKVISKHPAARLFCEPRSQLQDGPYPGMPVNCRSAFKYVRILYNGDVQLCSQFKIGNIYEKSLLDIWYGAEAERTRETLQRNADLCQACDYYRFCIKAAEVDYEDESNFFAQHVLPEADASPVPRLVEEGFQGFNLVGFRGQIYALAQSLGPVDLLSTAEETLLSYQARGECVIAASVGAVKEHLSRSPAPLRIRQTVGPTATRVTSLEKNFQTMARECRDDSPEGQRLRALYEDLAEPPLAAHPQGCAERSLRRTAGPKNETDL